MSAVDPRVERIHAFRRFHGLSIRRLSIKADVELGDLLDMDRTDWEPSERTLAALDRVIPSTFSTTTPATGMALHQRDDDGAEVDAVVAAQRFNRRRGRHGR